MQGSPIILNYLYACARNLINGWLDDIYNYFDTYYSSTDDDKSSDDDNDAERSRVL